MESNVIVVPPGHRLHNNLIVIPPEPKSIWCADDFIKLSRCGSGQYGACSFATVKGTNFLVVLKELNIEAMAGYNIALQLRREVEIAYNIRHKHILRTYGYYYDKDSVTLILEACPQGMLFSKLHRVGKFAPKQAARYVAQLGEALLYLHQHHVLHRDIKPENVLLCGEDIKLADFGWSVHSPSSRRKTTCGTAEYFPPEILQHSPYDSTADLWCLGVFAFEVLTGRTPFADKEQKVIFSNILRGTFEIPEFVDAEARDLIESLIVQNASKRLGLRQVLNHPFLMKNYYNAEGIAPPGRRQRDH